MPFFGQKPK